VSIGLSSIYDGYKLSRALRPVRKAVARATGLHGFISRKQYTLLDPECIIIETTPTVISIDEELGIHDVKAIEAELLARKFASQKMRRQEARKRKNNPRGNSGRRWGFRRRQQILSPNQNHLPSADIIVVPIIDASPDAPDQSRLKRVEEIDRLLHRGSERLLELQCERDDLLCAPNPLFNYTKKAYDPSINTTFGVVRTTRQFNFPPQELVDEYSKFNLLRHCSAIVGVAAVVVILCCAIVAIPPERIVQNLCTHIILRAERLMNGICTSMGLN
jgi:hypothetical protein